MIGSDRSRVFWSWVSEDEDVQRHALKGAELSHVMVLVEDLSNVVATAQHGGFIFRSMDGYGFCFELHTLFRREGWGREVAEAARQAFGQLFEGVTSLVVTEEQDGHWRSRPPRSHGWKAASDDFKPSPAGPVRIWYLSKLNWLSSPVGSR